jgi:hypothetical protein
MAKPSPRVDDEIGATDREVPIGLGLRGVPHDVAEMPTHAFQLGLELRQVLQQRAACVNALADLGCTLARVPGSAYEGSSQ